MMHRIVLIFVLSLTFLSILHSQENLHFQRYQIGPNQTTFIFLGTELQVWQNDQMKRLGDLYSLDDGSNLGLNQSDQNAAILNFFLERIDVNKSFEDAFFLSKEKYGINMVCYQKEKDSSYQVFIDKGDYKEVAYDKENIPNHFKGDLEYLYYLYMTDVFNRLPDDFEKERIKTKPPGFETFPINKKTCRFYETCSDKNWLNDPKQQCSEECIAKLVFNISEPGSLNFTFVNPLIHDYERFADLYKKASIANESNIHFKDGQLIITNLDSVILLNTAYERNISIKLKPFDLISFKKRFYKGMKVNTTERIKYSSTSIKNFFLSNLKFIKKNPLLLSQYLIAVNQVVSENQSGTCILTSHNHHFFQSEGKLYYYDRYQKKMDLIGDFPKYQPLYDPFLDYISEKIKSSKNTAIESLKVLDTPINGVPPMIVTFKDDPTSGFFFKDDSGKYRLFKITNLADYKESIASLVSILTNVRDMKNAVGVYKQANYTFLEIGNTIHYYNKTKNTTEELITGPIKFEETSAGLFIYQFGDKTSNNFVYIKKSNNKIYSPSDFIPKMPDKLRSRFFLEYERLLAELSEGHETILLVKEFLIINRSTNLFLGVNYYNGSNQLIDANNAINIYNFQWLKVNHKSIPTQFLSTILKEREHCLMELFEAEESYFVNTDTAVLLFDHNKLHKINHLNFPYGFNNKQVIGKDYLEQLETTRSLVIEIPNEQPLVLIQFKPNHTYYCYVDSVFQSQKAAQIINADKFLNDTSYLFQLCTNLPYKQKKPHTVFKLGSTYFSFSPKQLTIYECISTRLHFLIDSTLTTIDSLNAHKLGSYLLHSNNSIQDSIISYVYSADTLVELNNDTALSTTFFLKLSNNKNLIVTNEFKTSEFSINRDIFKNQPLMNIFAKKYSFTGGKIQLQDFLDFYLIRYGDRFVFNPKNTYIFNPDSVEITTDYVDLSKKRLINNILLKNSSNFNNFTIHILNENMTYYSYEDTSEAIQCSYSLKDEEVTTTLPFSWKQFTTNMNQFLCIEYSENEYDEKNIYDHDTFVKYLWSFSQSTTNNNIESIRDEFYYKEFCPYCSCNNNTCDSFCSSISSPLPIFLDFMKD